MSACSLAYTVAKPGPWYCRMKYCDKHSSLLLGVLQAQAWPTTLILLDKLKFVAD